MARCKVCGEEVRAGAVMHISCREALEKELMAKSEELAEREEELKIREMEMEIHEGFLDYYYKEILEESKRAKRMLIWNMAVAAFTITLCLLNVFR